MIYFCVIYLGGPLFSSLLSHLAVFLSSPGFVTNLLLLK